MNMFLRDCDLQRALIEALDSAEEGAEHLAEGIRLAIDIVQEFQGFNLIVNDDGSEDVVDIDDEDGDDDHV